MLGEVAISESELVSSLARESLARNLGRRTETYEERIRGVVFYADISGFSRLGAELVANAARGAEELRTIVNGILGQACETISAYGGHVLYYAGDAVMAVWPHDDTDIAARSADAIACGLEMQIACQNISAGLAGNQLEIRVSIDAGDVWLAHLCADQSAPRILFDGELLHAVTNAPRPKQRSGVLVAADLLSAIKPSLNTRMVLKKDPAGFLAVSIKHERPLEKPVRPSDIVALEEYLPAPVRSLLGPDMNWLAEFRAVQVLFACLPWDVSDARRDVSSLSAFTAALIDKIEDAGGAVIQLCNDDKGLVLLAGWGLPTSTFENSAERAVRAAQGIVKDADSWGLFPKVAVTAGKVFVGLIGGRSLYQYVMVGDPVNRAAAIAVKGVAPVLVDEQTRQAITRRYTTAHAGDLHIKGQKDAEPVYTPQAEKLLAAQHSGDMVGRAAERQRLKTILSRLTGGDLVDVHIFGDAGLGKSRLAEWFEQRLAASDIACYRMSADPLRQTIGFTPWKQIFTHLLDLDPNATPEACVTAVHPYISDDDYFLSLVPLLGPVLPCVLEDTEFTATLVGAGRAESARTIMVKLFGLLLSGQGEAKRPAKVILVEDAHWLDSASWQLLEYAKRSIEGLSFVIVSRPLDLDSLPSESRQRFGENAAEILDLQPLSRDDCVNLVCQVLDVVETEAAAIDLIYMEAEGHPLFTTTLARALLERGMLRIDGGYANLILGQAAPGQLSFPDGVEGFVRERISRLSANRQLMLKVASVLGREFDLDALAALYPGALGSLMLADEIAAIAQTALIEAVDGGKGCYRFHHAIIGDVAYDLLVTDQRQALHDAAGRRMELLEAGHGGSTSQSTLSMLAHHFERAGNTSKAIDYLARSAEGARVGYNNREVVDFLSRALAIADLLGADGPDKTTRGTWTYRIADALRALGQYQRAEEFLKTCATLLDRKPPETGLHAAGNLLRGYMAFRILPHRSPKADAVRLPILTAASANATLSEIHYELNKIPFALSEILQGANLARSAGGDSATLSKLYISMALMSTMLPWALDGDELQSQSLAMADRLGDPAVSSWVYMVSGTYETGKGGWKAGDLHLNHARMVGERCGERKNWETAMSCLGNLKRLEGRFEEAKGWSDLTLDASRDRGVVHGIIWSHNGRARDLLCLSRLDEVRVEVRALGKLLNDPAKKQNANDNNNLVYLYSTIFCALDAGDDATALRVMAELMVILSRIKRPQIYMVQNVDYYCDIIWNLWKRGHRGQLILDYQKLVVKSAKRVAKQYLTGKPMADLALGDLAWYDGKREAAASHWRESVKSATTRGMHYNAAHALFRLHETGQDSRQAATANHRDVLSELQIDRPVIWSLC